MKDAKTIHAFWPFWSSWTTSSSTVETSFTIVNSFDPSYRRDSNNMTLQYGLTSMVMHYTWGLGVLCKNLSHCMIASGTPNHCFLFRELIALTFPSSSERNMLRLIFTVAYLQIDVTPLFSQQTYYQPDYVIRTSKHILHSALLQ